MAATTPYADYEWYTAGYGGSLLTESNFPRYARWASALIDAMTYGNITSDDYVTDVVKDATCAAAEQAYQYWQANVNVDAGTGGTAKSESNDGYSITYGEVASTSSLEALKTECAGLIKIYLSNTGLLFRGVKVPRHGWWWPW